MATTAEPRSARRGRRAALDRAGLRAIALSVLAATLLTLLTIPTFTHLPRYQLPGRPILENADFREGFEGWEIEGLVTLDDRELGRAILQNRDPERTVYLRRTIDLPLGRTSLRLSADIATSRVQIGEEPWQAARVYLAPETPEGNYATNHPTRLVRLIGSTRRHHFDRIFDLPGGTSRVVLGVELPQTTGNMEVANLELEVVEELPLFRLAATLLVGGWTLLGFWVVARLHRGMGPAVRAGLTAMIAVGLVALWLPATLRQHLIAGLASGVGLHLADPDGFARALAFALLALLVRLGRPRDSLLLHVSCWLLAGAVAEVWQLFAAGGYPQASHWLTNALAAGLGLGLAEIALALQRIHRGPLPQDARHPPDDR